MEFYKKESKNEIIKYASIYNKDIDSTHLLSDSFIKELAEETTHLFKIFVGNYTEVIFEDGQPYDNVVEMQNDFFGKGILRISKDFNESPIFDKETNLLNRALHDYLHCRLSAPFTYEGEKKVFEATCLMMGKKFHSVMFSEFVLQTASTCAANGQFPVQKVVLVDKNKVLKHNKETVIYAVRNSILLNAKSFELKMIDGPNVYLNLPTAQKTGTFKQKSDYAKIKSIEILKNYL